MIAITYIRRNVDAIEAKYNAASKPLHWLLYSKLAIIEIGGWTELSMDDLVLRAGARLVETNNQNKLEKEIVKKNYGFDYQSNFRKMMIQTVGLVTVEKIERRLSPAIHAKFIAALGLLKAARDSCAHTYVKHPAATTITAPSVSSSYLNDIYWGLKDIENVMKHLKLV